MWLLLVFLTHECGYWLTDHSIGWKISNYCEIWKDIFCFGEFVWGFGFHRNRQETTKPRSGFNSFLSFLFSLILWSKQFQTLLFSGLWVLMGSWSAVCSFLPVSLISSQLLAQFARLPFPGLECSLGVQQLVQLPADAGHVQLGGLALLPQASRLHPQLRGGDGKLLASLPALHLHPPGIAEEGLHAYCHRLPLVLWHVLGRGQRS